MSIITITISCYAMSCVAEKECKLYAAVLGLLIGIAASLAFSGMKMDDVLDAITTNKSTGVEKWNIGK